MSALAGAIARGRGAHDAANARRVTGGAPVEIETILGYRGRDDMIHRGDLAVLCVKAKSE